MSIMLIAPCGDANAVAASNPGQARSALVVFLSPVVRPAKRPSDETIQSELESIPGLSVGILSATQGAYSTAQLILDIGQGARISPSAYKTAGPPSMRIGAEGVVQGWSAALARARSAPQLLNPGLLATRVPGGGAYVPSTGIDTVDGILAAERNGRVALIPTPSTAPIQSVDRAMAAHMLVVADLPANRTGYEDLRALAAHRPARELLIAIQRPYDVPDNADTGQNGNELLWSGVAGVGGSGQTLTSQTTNQRGLIAAIDIAPTILDHLGLAIPPAMRGRPIHTDGSVNSASLRALKSRLGVISSRRVPAIAWLLAAWALLIGAACLPFGSLRRAGGARARGSSRRQTRINWSVRVGALAILWTPVAVLVPAAFEPSRNVEFALIVAACFTLGGLTDRLTRWPRAPLLPAVTAVVALSVDALAGTQLLMRSLLGPNPAFGARFYGIGNELKSALAVLVLIAVASAMYPAVRSRRTATTMACAGILLAIVEGSARIGAGVGGVILVSAGTAVATVMLLPGKLNRKRVLIVTAAPLAGLVALAALDLATSHGGGHFTGSVLDARSTGDIRDIIVRRYSAAYDELRNHLMPVATAVALLASAIAVRRYKRVCAPVDSDPAWLAALAGGLTAGVVGALTEDSGPVLLVVAVFMLACVLSYLWGKPPASPPVREVVDRARQGRTERGVLGT